MYGFEARRIQADDLPGQRTLRNGRWPPPTVSCLWPGPGRFPRAASASSPPVTPEGAWECLPGGLPAMRSPGPRLGQPDPEGGGGPRTLHSARPAGDFTGWSSSSPSVTHGDRVQVWTYGRPGRLLLPCRLPPTPPQGRRRARRAVGPPLPGDRARTSLTWLSPRGSRRAARGSGRSHEGEATRAVLGPRSGAAVSPGPAQWGPGRSQKRAGRRTAEPPGLAVAPHTGCSLCGPRARNGVSGATGVTQPPRDRAGGKQRLPRSPPRGHSACASRGSPDVVTRADAWAAPWTPRWEVPEGLDIRVSTRFAGDSGAAGPCRGGRSFPALPPPVLGASARVPKPRPVVAGWRPQPQAESGFKAGPPGSRGRPRLPGSQSGARRSALAHPSVHCA